MQTLTPQYHGVDHGASVMIVMRNWREYYPRVGVQLTPEQYAAHERQERLFQQAVDIFGNEEDAAMWCLRPRKDLPPFETPANVAGDNAEGLSRALAILAEFATTIAPQPPRYAHRVARRTHRRRR